MKLSQKTIEAVVLAALLREAWKEELAKPFGEFSEVRAKVKKADMTEARGNAVRLLNNDKNKDAYDYNIAWTVMTTDSNMRKAIHDYLEYVGYDYAA